MATLLAVGDNVVDCYPKLNLMFPGGNCVNVAVEANRLGLKSSYLGAVGADSNGQVILDALAAEEVSFERGRIVAGPTAHCVIGHTGTDRIFLDSALGVSRFELDQEDIAFARNYTIVHSAQLCGTDEYIEALAEQTLVSYDFSTQHLESFVREIGQYCFLASFSGGALTSREARDLARIALETGATWVLITLGDRGAMLSNSEATFTAPAKETEVVDTLGAGDAFVATVLAGLLRNEKDVNQLLLLAADRAADVCTRYGGIGHGRPYIEN